ncbi:META domain-containing protein [Hymenobacter cavernae]|nr:META domain-containing protein [Hymenobacter cavernae]
MPIYLRLFSCLFLSLGLLLSSYSPKAESAPTAARSNPLAQHWVLRTLDGATVPISLQADDATARLLRSTSGSAQKAGSRRYVGVFTHSLGTRLMALTKVIKTLIKCDGNTMSMELHYLTALEQSTYYKLDGSTLSLFDKEGAAPRATFEAIQ